MTFEEFLKAPEIIAYQVNLLDSLIDELRESVGSLQSPNLSHIPSKGTYRPKNPIGYLCKIDYLVKERENLLLKEKSFHRQITLLIPQLSSQEVKHVIISRYLYGFSMQRIAVMMGIPKERVEKDVLLFRSFAKKRGRAHTPNAELLPSNSKKLLGKV